MDPVLESLKALNEAAYAARKAGKNTEQAETLRQIYLMTNDLVDNHKRQEEPA